MDYQTLQIWKASPKNNMLTAWLAAGEIHNRISRIADLNEINYLKLLLILDRKVELFTLFSNFNALL